MATRAVTHDTWKPLHNRCGGSGYLHRGMAFARKTCSITRRISRSCYP